MMLEPERGRPLTDAEQEWLAALLHDVGPRILGYVRRMLRPPSDAEDIVAETFARAAANIAALKRSDRPDFYLLATARNLVRDRFRRHAASSHPTDFFDQQPDPAMQSHRIMQAELRQRLTSAIENLPEPCREVLVLRLSAELRFEEIANLLRIPLGTALSRMHTAVKKLRSQLDDDDAATANAI